MRANISKTVRGVGEKGLLWLKIAVLVAAGLMPALTFSPAEAAQLQSRSVTIDSSAIPNTDVEHQFSYTIPTAGEVEGIMYRFCDTPLGACSLPSGMSVQSADQVGQTGWSGATAFAALPNTSDVGDCDILTTDNVMCFTRTDTTSESGAVTHTISNITAPSSYQTVYIRITLYVDADFQTVDATDDGVVASAYVRQLTVTGRVAERLEFCVGAIEDTGGTPADTPSNCTGLPTTTEIGIGVIDDQAIYVTPVTATATNIANESYGMAMVNTNASGGVAISYFPEEASSTTGSDTDKLRAFRVVPTDCSPTVGSLTDQCFESAGTTSETFTTGTERFGMYIPCVDSLHDSITTENLIAEADYRGTDGNANDETVATGATSAESCQQDEKGSNVDFAFNENATPDLIATSSSVVHNEAVKLAFGATASATTPEGSYTVTLTYVATPTF